MGLQVQGLDSRKRRQALVVRSWFFLVVSVQITGSRITARCVLMENDVWCA